MRQAALALAIALVVAGSSEAQYRGRAPAGRTYGSPSGFGNVLFPGVGTAPPMTHNPFVAATPTFAQRLGSTISGAGYPSPARPPRTGRHQQGGYAYAVPVYYGYGYGGGFGSGYSAYEQPPVTVYNETPPQPAVIINQYYTADGRPPQNQVQDGNPGGVRSYQAPVSSDYEAPEASEEPRSPVSEQKPTLYLIAYRDGSIYATLAYWIEGDTLNYITTQGAHNRASLDLIDRPMSEQLNRERRVEFNLSAAR